MSTHPIRTTPRTQFKWVALAARRPKFISILLPILLLFPLALQTFSQQIPSKYTNDWRNDPGLWGSNPEMRRTAWILAAAGMDKVLGIINTTKVLQNLRTAQVKSGEVRGNFWWRWNDGRVTDRNAGFFVTLGLLTLVHTGEGQLNQAQRELLDTILRDAQYWFNAEAKKLGSLRYPNKFLGDVVCMWLLAERFGTPTPEQHKILDTTLAYYRDHNWGWGEHMSDIYASILQDELMAMYMWGTSLSPRQKKEVWDLFLELVAIDDIFGVGPRVPAIRSYSANSSPSGSHYRQKMRPWSPNSSIGGWQPLQSMAYNNNIPALLPKKPEPSRYAEIDCYGGARALVTWTDKWRLGAMSRYQIMDGIDRRNWGMSWQSIPVAYWRNGGDWGFLQWESVVNGSSRTHPQPYSSSLTGAAKALADSGPGMIGMTHSVRRGDGYVVLRRIRRSSQWTSFKDRFRLIRSSTTPKTRKSGDWSIMDLDYGSGGGLQLQFLPLIGQGTQTLVARSNNNYDWESRYNLAGDEFAALWILMPLPGDSRPPEVQRNGGTVILRWPDGDLRQLEFDIGKEDTFWPSSIKTPRHNPAGAGLSWSQLSNQSMAVHYSLPSASQISLGVYDVNGERVRVLADKPEQAGDHVAMWDRRDGRGNYLSNGIYYLRLATGSQVLTEKMVLLR